MRRVRISTYSPASSRAGWLSLNPPGGQAIGPSSAGEQAGDAAQAALFAPAPPYFVWGVALAPQLQFRISGKSSPCSSM
jgi:hypothetical protein